MAFALYLDCFSGASGDMLMGALLDAGASIDTVRDGLMDLPVGGWCLSAEPVVLHGLRGTRAHVTIDESVPRKPRHLATVLDLITRGNLPDDVQTRASRVFQRLAEAEAHVHGVGVEEVHFHEVGAVDAIVDVVGVVYALHLLAGPNARVYASGLPLGTGWAHGEHGALPVPGPATLELLRRSGAPTRRPPRADESGELTTPTGAALITTLATFDQPAFSHVERVGYGFGTKVFSWPNAVRVWFGEMADTHGPALDAVVQIETNLDDATPEELGYAMERLLEAGALDVAFTPLQMKKNRPGVLVSVLSPPARARTLAEMVLLHTSALGVRVQTLERLVAERSVRLVTTPWGEVQVKEKHLGERRFSAPEYEDCAALARAHGVPLQLVFDAARAASDALPR